MLHALARILFYVKWRTVTIDTLDAYIWPPAKSEWQITLSNESSLNGLLELSVQCQRIKTLAVHCHCDVCIAAGGHSAGWRTSWVCLQHHATVIRSNGVEFVAASFQLPSVSTANISKVQYTKPHKQREIPTITALVIFKALLPQSNIMAAFVHQAQQSILWCLSRPANI